MYFGQKCLTSEVPKLIMLHIKSQCKVLSLAPTWCFFLALGLCLAFSKISCIDLRQAQQCNELSHLTFFCCVFFVAIWSSLRQIPLSVRCMMQFHIVTQKGNDQTDLLKSPIKYNIF